MSGVVVRAPWAWPLVRGQVRRFFARRAEGWDERTGAGSPEHLAPLAAALARVPESPERVLDMGCGTGEGSFLIAREFPHAMVFGVDLSAEMVAAAKAKIRHDPHDRMRFSIADASALPYGRRSFELVALLNMPPFFREIARVLKPGGHVIVASSHGSRTPFHTPQSQLHRGFARCGVEQVDAGEVGGGTFFVGRLDIPAGTQPGR